MLQSFCIHSKLKIYYSKYINHPENMNPQLYNVLAHKMMPEIFINVKQYNVHLEHLKTARDCIAQTVAHSSIFTILGATFGSISVTTGRDLVSVQPERLSKSKPVLLWIHTHSTHTHGPSSYTPTNRVIKKTVWSCMRTRIL